MTGVQTCALPICATFSWQAASVGNTAAIRSSASIRWMAGGFFRPPRIRSTVSEVLRFHRQRAANSGEVSTACRTTCSTEAEAREAAARLLSRLDPETGEQIRRRSLDTTSAGNARQRELREAATDDGFAEPGLWTGIGRARSGAGAAIVGDPDQVLAKLRAYQELGMEAFILSGYPHIAEGDLFARHVLPRLEHGPLFAR